MGLVEYRAIPYKGAVEPMTVDDIEKYIMTTNNKTIARDAVLRVLEWHRSREKELEDRIHQLELSGLRSDYTKSERVG